MASPERSSLFFTLPIELREQIYKEVLKSPSQGTELLRTCREIKAEVRKFLFQRPLSFSSQQALFRWIDRSPLSLLHYVREISLSVRIANQQSSISRDIPVSGSTFPHQMRMPNLYDAELANLGYALQKLPSVQTITIRALTTSQDPPYREFLAKVLAMLGSLYPALHELRLEGNMHRQSLAYLTSLKQLRAFSFDGISSTTSSEAGRILASLKNLNSLSLVSRHDISPPSSPLSNAFGTKTLSFNGDVMRTMNQLASFSVVEHKSPTTPTLFFTSDILAALQHHQRLHNLSVSLSHNPDRETLKALQEFLEGASISHLELDWPDLVPQVLQHYHLVRDNLQVLWIRVRSTSDALQFVESLHKARSEGRLQHLNQMVFLRSIGNYNNANHMGSPPCHADELRIQRLRKQLQLHGVQIAWCTEDP